MPDSDASNFPIGAALTLSDLDAAIHTSAAELRTTEPISWVPAIGGWFVTGHGLVDRILRDARTFTVDDPRFSTGRVLGPSMLSTDGHEQARYRSAFERPFRRRVVDADYATTTQRIAYRLVGDLAAEGAADLRFDLASPLAVEAITAVLGLAFVEPSTVAGWYRALVEAVDEVSAGGFIPQRGRDARAELSDTVAQTIRRSTAGLITEIAWTHDLSPEEITSNVGVVMFGAIETSEAMTSSALWHLLSQPALAEQVSAKRALVPKLIEESLRLEPAASVIDRYATTSVRLGNAHIRKGDFVQLSLSGANRDPAVFRDPDELRLDRPNTNQHMSFVKGPHACLGLHLARLETEAALNAVLDLLPGIRLVDPEAATPTGRIFRKPPTLQASWSATP